MYEAARWGLHGNRPPPDACWGAPSQRQCPSMTHASSREAATQELMLWGFAGVRGQCVYGARCMLLGGCDQRWQSSLRRHASMQGAQGAGGRGGAGRERCARKAVGQAAGAVGDGRDARERAVLQPQLRAHAARRQQPQGRPRACAGRQPRAARRRPQPQHAHAAQAAMEGGCTFEGRLACEGVAALCLVEACRI